MFILPGALAPLSRFRQFIIVRFESISPPCAKYPSGKSAKYPVHPDTLKNHDAHDSAIWLDVSTASRISAALGPGWGVGFVITAADPVVCFDIDECLTAEGAWSAHALAMLAAFPTACEVSNSGGGLHGWGLYQGTVPEHRKRAPKVNGIDLHMELYTSKRFIALGTAASGTMCDLTNILPGFISKWFPPDPSGHNDFDPDAGPHPDYTPLTDEELFIKARASSPKQDALVAFGGAAGMASFSDLFDRNVSALARIFPPQSSGKDFDYSAADAALAKELAYWTGRDAARVARLMLQSSLKRNKWDLSVHRSYFADTVSNGVGRCKSVYHVKPILPAAISGAPGSRMLPQVITHNTFIGRENLAVIFDGCVYTRDENKILMPNGDIVDQARFNVEFAGYAFSMDNVNDRTTTNAWDAFTANQIIRFPRVNGTAFDPRAEFQSVIERGGRTWVNTYKPPVINRAPGDVSRFTDLLKRLLPNGDDALILLSYMAAVAQNPGLKFRWAPFIQGIEGNGKSTIVSCLVQALGDKYVFNVKAGMIENGFNAWLENNILYVADDIYSSKDRTDMMEALKSLITESRHAITYKGIDAIQKRICGNFIFTDNHKDAMQKRDATRRICTLYCAQQSPRDRVRDGLSKSYFVGRNGLVPWLESGGYAAVTDMLLTMEIDARYDPSGECQEAPETSATREAVIDGRTGIEHEIAELVELGEPGFCGDFVSMTMLKRKFEGTQFAKYNMSHLKLKETMGRLGYEIHRGMDGGRVVSVVMPDNTRPVLFVKADSVSATLVGAAVVGMQYAAAQNAAMTAAIDRKFNPPA